MLQSLHLRSDTPGSRTGGKNDKAQNPAVPHHITVMSAAPPGCTDTAGVSQQVRISFLKCHIVLLEVRFGKVFINTFVFTVYRRIGHSSKPVDAAVYKDKV